MPIPCSFSLSVTILLFNLLYYLLLYYSYSAGLKSFWHPIRSLLILYGRFGWGQDVARAVTQALLAQLLVGGSFPVGCALAHANLASTVYGCS